MAKNLEVEVWGLLLDKKTFEDSLKRFTLEFGEPRIQKRLAFDCNNFFNKQLDTRIKITNGKAHLVQKVGTWNLGGALSREELDVDIPDDPQNILQTYKILKNIVEMYSDEKTKKGIEFVAQQFENYLFDSEKFELKVTYQFGASDQYLFELEAKQEGVNVADICKDLGLVPDLEPRDEDYWMSWNKKVNLDLLRMEDSEILELIKKYTNE